MIGLVFVIVYPSTSFFDFLIMWISDINSYGLAYTITTNKSASSCSYIFFPITCPKKQKIKVNRYW